MITANPDIIKVSREGMDYIIMGCDGIWETKTNEEMVKWINKRLAGQKPLSSILE